MTNTIFTDKKAAVAALREAVKAGLYAAGTRELYGTRVDGVDQYEIREKAQPTAAAKAATIKAMVADTVAKTKPAPKGKGKPVAPVVADVEMGVCGHIQAYANANPTASRKEVIAHHVALGRNKATASIQTKKADDRAGRVRPA
ncbi:MULTISPECIES: hypothetical protein [unclassified Mesorhizobium]|uniref:hypothetical protein n=1 Tax=unclassified Mesorhizobium TaxID=325217 RepID=UPI000FCC9BDC|nr:MULTISPECIES: hypothetical protein [unclassified Mesorhizobium]RUX97429.1 hypothetical protein EN993_03770 [Mesorhizobium sp. M7D.F.Ca.US.004.01.2.1]RVA36615.1 hypothetical protein EN935_01580 [Mesorhizobium sp. M7D.F.Ca.US.004.03.1.1]